MAPCAASRAALFVGLSWLPLLVQGSRQQAFAGSSSRVISSLTLAAEAAAPSAAASATASATLATVGAKTEPQKHAANLRLFWPEVAELVAEAKAGTASSDEPQSFTKVLIQSFTLMCAAEIFDQTWFVTLVCSLRYGAWVSFVGAFSALAVHSVLAVSFGWSFASLLPAWSLDLVAGLVLGVFATFYAWESYTMQADGEVLKARREEAQEVAGSSGGNPQEESSTFAGETAPVAASSGEGEQSTTIFKMPALTWAGFSTVFATIFLAEWGDRTQIVQISLASTLPWLPVLLGSLMGLFLLCLSAVLLSKFMEGKEVDQRMLNAICAIAFGVMAIVTLYNARNGFLAAYS